MSVMCTHTNLILQETSMTILTKVFTAIVAVGLIIALAGFSSSHAANADLNPAQDATATSTWGSIPGSSNMNMSQLPSEAKTAQQCLQRGDICNFEACPGGNGECQSNCCAGLTCKLYPAQPGSTGSSGCE